MARSRKNKNKRSQAQRPSKKRTAPVSKTRQIRTKYASDSIRVRHREFLTAVSAQETELRQHYAINPGLSETFPWLSAIARNYETYTVHRVVFEYVPRCSATTPGSITFAPDFDPADDNSKLLRRQLLAFKGAVSTALWDSAEAKFLGSELHRKDVHYVRAGDLGPGQDIKTYDVAQLEILTQASVAAELVVGDLYLNYDITLHTPQTSADILPDVMQYWGTTDGVGLAQPLGDEREIPVLRSSEANSWATSIPITVTDNHASGFFDIISLVGSEAFKGLAGLRHNGSGFTDTGELSLVTFDPFTREVTSHNDGVNRYKISDDINAASTEVHHLHRINVTEAMLESGWGQDKLWGFGYKSTERPVGTSLTSTLFSLAAQAI